MMKKMTYEKAMERLEEIVKELENGSLALEKSLELYEEGTKLSAFCNSCLNDAELKITQFVNAKKGNEGEN